ncbi:NAD(P)(+) transhydrogenase (Re/Si-specific) subunit beta [Petrimonas sulfuriphila]|uniref:NAD(P)(+) transhydrogenase (Re/Si-specific) subunit beta n=1 Tax=Petrimonas sulfuriphila TaxID=285070 RepID=UPI003EBD5BC3
MTPTLYYVVCAVLSVTVLLGISMMSRVKTAVRGNIISAASVLAGIVVTLLYNRIASVGSIYVYMLVGVVIGSAFAVRVKMIQMPQLVALLNGVGGLASALVGILTLLGVGQWVSDFPVFSNVTAVLAIVVGVITLVGSLVAAGKLHKLLSQRPVIWKNHAAVLNFSLIVLTVSVVYSAFAGNVFGLPADVALILLISIAFSALFGFAFSIRVGGADMPITISLLNSLSGVAGAIAGMAISDILLVSVGGIVGASGLFLTQIMCRSMNRSLMDILTGKTSVSGKKVVQPQPVMGEPKGETSDEQSGKPSAGEILRNARSVIIVPGYGMALAQAQHLVRQLADKLEANGAEVRYAIHPVAGRMPGHMNVLLAEADVPYEQLYEMDTINGDFKDTDAVIVIGANDVLNPAARDAVDTPIYGMPVLNVDEAPEVFICNFDLSPGYAGVENPLYTKRNGVHLMLGDAKDSVGRLLSELDKKEPSASSSGEEPAAVNSSEKLRNARSVIIVPGYGMALAQAQHLVRQLADKLEANGAEVRYAIHPVAGRMPGHMNVLLAEADVPYEQLYEMDAINGDFKDTDAVIVIGANDVLNPAARDAVDTPIYGMPVLNVDEAPEVFICNFDLSPGYAGVENPLYTKRSGVHLMLGDAKESLSTMIAWLN